MVIGIIRKPNKLGEIMLRESYKQREKWQTKEISVYRQNTKIIIVTQEGAKAKLQTSCKHTKNMTKTEQQNKEQKRE